MVKAVRVHIIGGRHHVQLEDVELPHPGCNEVEVRHTAIGLNSPDIDACNGGGHHRAHSTFTPGLSAVGVITELGTGVINHRIGQRVGYVNAPNMGAFSEATIIPVSCLIVLPDHVTDEEAAALLFQGLTTWMLLKKVCTLHRADTILVHNAASGVGALISQWADALRTTVIGTVGSRDDVEQAEKNGCKEVVLRTDDGYSGFVDDVRELTGGEGVAIVFDMVGKSTFTGSLACLAPKGMFVSLGATQGDAPVLNFKDLAGRGSLLLAFPVLGDYVRHHEDLLEGAQDLFELHKAGKLQVKIGNKYPLNNIRKALDAVATGQVSGSCILIPPIPDPKNTPHGS